MGKIDCCVKTVFVFFNSLFTVSGASMIYNLLQTHGMFDKYVTLDSSYMIWMWVTAIAVFGISLLGSCASCNESKTGLKIFAGFMGIGMIIMLGCGILVLSSKYQIHQMDVDDNIKRMLELSFKMRLGISFGLFFIAMMGLIIAVNMIKQISHHENTRGTAIPMTAI